MHLEVREKQKIVIEPIAIYETLISIKSDYVKKTGVLTLDFDTARANSSMNLSFWIICPFQLSFMLT